MSKTYFLHCDLTISREAGRPEETYKAGETVSDLPEVSIPWLLEQGLISEFETSEAESEEITNA